MRNQFSTRLVLIALIVALAAGSALAQAPAAKKNWKDTAEYEQYNAIVKEQDPVKKLGLLDAWKQKYPTTDFVQERSLLYIQTLTTAVGKTLGASQATPEVLANGEKFANTLLSGLDEYFAANVKPANVSDADWAKAKTGTEALAHTALGWIHMQKKENEPAEQEFIKSLKAEPNNAQVSYWLGTVILSQRKPEKQAQAIYHFARAASLEGPGALTPEGKAQIDPYFVRIFSTFHGKDDAELQKLRDTAKASALPPEGWVLKNVNEIAAENEEDFMKKNPMLAMWMNLKKELTGANAEQYFESSLKGAAIPGGAHGVTKFKGVLISSKPAAAPKELVLGVSDPNTPDVTLKLENPMRGKADAGTPLEFEGVVNSYTKDPFMLTLDVDDNAKVVGWPAPAPAKKAVGAKKAAPAAKKK